MDRKEALKYVNEKDKQFNFKTWDVTPHINKIYDDFESRTCENCTHMKQVSENNKWCDLLEQYNLKYCSEFVNTDTKGI